VGRLGAGGPEGRPESRQEQYKRARARSKEQQEAKEAQQARTPLKAEAEKQTGEDNNKEAIPKESEGGANRLK